MQEKSRSLKWLWSTVIVIIFISVVWWVYCRFSPVTTVFFVRHADRAGPEIDELHEPLGTRRAKKLVHVLGSAGITAIYHSDTVRAQQTAQPLANHIEITPVQYTALGTEQLVEDIFSHNLGGRILVVGHSNTVPDIIERFSGRRPPDIPESVYDNLYILTLCPCRLRTLSILNLKYGVPTYP